MPNNQTIQTRTNRALATIVPGSYNAETFTLDVEFGSEKPVLRYNWDADELYNEVLEMSESAANLGRVNIGASVLKDHRQSMDHVVGVTVKGWIEGKKAIATIRLSDTPENASFRQNVANGIFRNISFGYNVDAYTRSQKDKTSVPIYRATSWEAVEISFVPIPADETVGTRSKEEVRKNELQLRSERTLHSTNLIDTEMPKLADGGTENQDPVAEPQGRAAEAPNPADSASERAEGAKAERVRSATIRSEARGLQLSDEFTENLITTDVPVDKARELMIAEWTKKDPAEGVRGQHTIKVGEEAIEKQRNVRATAMALRTGHVREASVDKTMLAEVSGIRSLTLMGLARLCLEEAGVRTHLMGNEEIAKRAITQSTSEFPVLLGNIIHQVLLGAYTEIDDTWREFCSIGSVSDFRDHRMIRSWGLQNLPKVGETEEYKNIPLVDATGEVVRVYKYGGIINLSWEAMVNDELGAFNELVADLTRSYFRTIEDEVYATLALNSYRGPLMSDNKTLYHADHNNLITAAAMSSAALDNIRVKMKAQKDQAGRFIGFKPSILLVNDVNESMAKIYNSSEYDITVDATKTPLLPNRSRGLFKKIVSSPRVLGPSDATTPYYAFADPNAEPVLRVSFLDGNQSPIIERHEEFRTDGTHWKIRGVFGVGAVGYRGTQLNPGA